MEVAKASHTVAISGIAGEALGILCLPGDATIGDVKVQLEASQGINPLRMQLVLGSSGSIIDDGDTLENLPQPLALMLVKLAYADANDAEVHERLLTAAAEGNEAVTQELLGVPVWPDCTDTEGRTPLFLAARHGHIAIAQLLVGRAGADRDKAQNRGASPLHVSAHQGHTELVRLLCTAGAMKDARQEHGATPLHVAAQSGRAEVVRALCDAGADQDVAMPDGRTPVYVAFQNGHAEVARALGAATPGKTFKKAQTSTKQRQRLAM